MNRQELLKILQLAGDIPDEVAASNDNIVEEAILATRSERLRPLNALLREASLDESLEASVRDPLATIGAAIAVLIGIGLETEKGRQMASAFPPSVSPEEIEAFLERCLDHEQPPDKTELADLHTVRSAEGLATEKTGEAKRRLLRRLRENLDGWAIAELRPAVQQLSEALGQKTA